MAEEELKGKALKIELARVAIRAGLKIGRSEGDKLQMLVAAVGLLNQAQGLAGVADTKARRLLAVAKTLMKK